MQNQAYSAPRSMKLHRAYSDWIGYTRLRDWWCCIAHTRDLIWRCIAHTRIKSGTPGSAIDDAVSRILGLNRVYSDPRSMTLHCAYSDWIGFTRLRDRCNCIAHTRTEPRYTQLRYRWCCSAHTRDWIGYTRLHDRWSCSAHTRTESGTPGAESQIGNTYSGSSGNFYLLCGSRHTFSFSSRIEFCRWRLSFVCVCVCSYVQYAFQSAVYELAALGKFVCPSSFGKTRIYGFLW